MSAPDKPRPPITSETPAALLARRLAGPPEAWPAGWEGWENTREAHRLLFAEARQACPPYPESLYQGRGIVSCVSARPGWSSGKSLSHGYLPGAWCLARELRRHGCTLPITFCHMGPLEWDPSLTRLVADLGIDVLDLSDETADDPMRILAGWESKIYSICRAPYEQVLFIDADNLPLADPTPLFDLPQARHYGCLLWPDVPPYDRAEWLPPAVWENVGLPSRPDVQAAESGQVWIDKRKCWQELQATRWLNEHSDYAYKWLFGDKDTFVLGWRRVAADRGQHSPPAYFMHDRPPGGDHGGLIHWDVNGRPLFQHLTRNKPTLKGFPSPASLVYRKECEGHLAELSGLWSGRLWRSLHPTEKEQAATLALRQSGPWTYTRIGLDARTLTFLEEHRIGQGLAYRETDWDVVEEGDDLLLVLSGIDGLPTVFLRPEGEAWVGQWIEHERCQVRLAKQT